MAELISGYGVKVNDWRESDLIQKWALKFQVQQVNYGAGAPGIVPASGHVEDPAQQTQRILETQRPHKRVPGSCAFARYAVAFLGRHAPCVLQRDRV